MIYLYSATPGTGKTCYVVKQLVDNWLNDPDNANRKIYHNINGLKIEGLYQAPDDFRQCDDGSIIIYDEAQDIDYYSSDSRSINEVAKELSKHRHRGFDIHFITQDPALLTKWVLKNVYLHYYLWRPAQASTITIYTFSRAIVSPTKTDFKNAYDKKLWRFEKKYLDYYKSTVLNTSKKTTSQKKNSIIATAIIMLLVLAYFSKPLLSIHKPPQTQENKKEQGVSDTTQQATQQATPPQTQATQSMGFDDTLKTKYLDAYNVETMHDDTVRAQAVIHNSTTCVAYNKYGDKLNIDKELCEKLARDGVPKAKQQDTTQEVQQTQDATQDTQTQRL